MNAEQREYIGIINQSAEEVILIKRTGWEEVNLPGHVHGKCQIIYTLAGTLHVEIGSESYFVPEKHIAWIPQGLGVYKGIEKITVEGVEKDYIKIEYAGNSNLYVLATQLDRLQKYAAADTEKKPKLNKLGTQEWNKTKSKVHGAVEEVAKDLVALYAARQKEKGYQFGPDTVWQREFEEMFPYEETQDQLTAKTRKK